MIITQKAQENKTEEQKKWTERKIKAKNRAEKMRQAGFIARANRMAQCGDVLDAQICQSCGHIHITQARLCRDRMCPICKWRLSMSRFASMMAIVNCVRAETTAEWDAITLTGKNCKAVKLQDQINEMMTAWNRIMSGKKTKELYQGWARSLEITYNAKTREFHPHFHCLFVRQEDMESEKGISYIIRRWMATTGFETTRIAQEGHTIKARGLETAEDEAIISAVLETFKYAVKEGKTQDGKDEIAEMPLKDFRALCEILQNRRLIGLGGIIKYWAKELQEEEQIENGGEDTEKDITEATDRCTKCGSGNLVAAVAEWSEDHYNWREII